MGCTTSTAGPVKPLVKGYEYPPQHLSKYDAANGPFWRMRPEDLRPINYPTEGPYSEKELPAVTLLKAFFQAKSVHGDSPALKVERPCPPLNADGTAPPALPDDQWQTWTWSQYWDDSRRVAKALVACGVQRYEGVTVYGFNAPEWNLSQMGITMAGALTAGIYPTDAPEAVSFKTIHSRAQVAIVEDEGKVKRYEEVLEQIPRLKYIVGYSPDFKLTKTIQTKNGEVKVLPWAAFLELGANVPDSKLDEIEATISPADCAGLIYTSGTTGNPKAVMVSHDNMMMQCRSLFFRVPAIGAAGQERVISFLPLSHVAACTIDIVGPICVTAFRPGYETVYFARPYDLKASTIGDRLRLVRPTIFLGVPRVWEKIKEKMQAKGKNTKGLKKMIVDWAKAKGLEYSENMLLGGSGEIPSGFERAHKMVLSKVADTLGLDQAKVLGTAAAPIDRATLAYFGAVGLNVNEIYGMSECAGASTFSTDEAHIWGSVGSSFAGLEVKILRKEGDKYVEAPRAKDLFNPTEDEQGEICYRGRSIMLGYMSCPDINDEEEVRKKNLDAIDSEGWLHSGDKGCCDTRNMFKVTGRYKELIIGAGGENIAPVPIEDCIKRLGKGFISNVQMVGDKRKYNVALITLVTKGATGERPGSNDLDGLALDVVPGVTTVSEAMKNQQFIQKLEQIIKDTNADGTACPSNAAKITKFTILPQDYSVETEELTATLKLKRAFTENKYIKAIEAMYDESLPATTMYVPYKA